jgi:hypothetical protein
LALALGCTVRELLRRIDSHELTEWMAYYGIRPFGEEPADIRMGVLASPVANCVTTSGGFKPSDFLPEYRREPEPQQTDEQIKDMAVRINAMLGGTVT